MQMDALQTVNWHPLNCKLSTDEIVFGVRNNRMGGTASLRSRTCVKRRAVFGARFKGLYLHFLYQKGIWHVSKRAWIYIYIYIYIYGTYPNPSPPPCHGGGGYPTYDYSKEYFVEKGDTQKGGGGALGPPPKFCWCYQIMVWPHPWPWQDIPHQSLLCSVEPKVRLQGYGFNPFCSHSSRCLAVLVWQYFEEAFCAPKVRLKWYGFKGFPSHSSHCSGGLFPQYSGVSPYALRDLQQLGIHTAGPCSP